MKRSDCLEFVIMAVVCAMVHFMMGGSARESSAYAFRFIVICAVFRAGCDLIERLRR
ncbi:hypothetical protein [Sphingomonas aurantiaca]|uniref:hypothetical protein n=1 Tax=Sphingomonas aurantiaca TaxID=185949 RepID=UPI00334A2AF8